MAYEFLKKLFGKNEDGTPKSLTYEELETAIDGDKKLRIVNLEDGGYVAKEQLDAKSTELAGVKQQLTDANKEIQSYKDMDIEKIQQSAKEWETKYNTDTKALNEKLAAQERSHQTDRYLDTVGLKAGAMYRDFVKKAFEAKEFKLEGGKFLGADDFIADLKKNPEFKDAFVQENKNPDGNAAGQQGDSSAEMIPDTQGQQNQLPQFAMGTGGMGAAAGAEQNPFLNFGFTDVRPRPNAGVTRQ